MYRDNNGLVAQDSGRVRLHQASRDPLTGSFLDADGKRRKYVGSQLYVLTNDQWVVDGGVRAVDSSTGNPPAGKSIRQNYLDELERRARDARERVPATPAAGDAPVTGDSGASIKSSYLVELERRARG